MSVLAVQTDGKILIGGRFSTVNGVARHCIARLNADGALDQSFNLGTGVTRDWNTGLTSIAIHSDGDIVLGGRFNEVNGIARTNVARLHRDGSLDTSFNANNSFGADEYWVNAVAVQPDGKVLLAGQFRNGDWKPIVRLNASGSMDATFRPEIVPAGALSGSALLLQEDGKIWLAGSFLVMRGSDFGDSLALLEPEGSLNSNFVPKMHGWLTLSALGRQPDGKLILAGDFVQLDQVPHSRVARFNADGSVDHTFNRGAGPNAQVRCLALQPDGKLWIGGDFTTVDNVRMPGLARLNVDGSLDVNVDLSSVTKIAPFALVSLPEDRVLVGGSFEAPWSPQGAIAKLMAGEPEAAAPTITIQPASQTVLAPNNATFHVRASGFQDFRRIRKRMDWDLGSVLSNRWHKSCQTNQPCESNRHAIGLTAEGANRNARCWPYQD